MSAHGNQYAYGFVLIAAAMSTLTQNVNAFLIHTSHYGKNPLLCNSHQKISTQCYKSRQGPTLYNSLQKSRRIENLFMIQDPFAENEAKISGNSVSSAGASTSTSVSSDLMGDVASSNTNIDKQFIQEGSVDDEHTSKIYKSAISRTIQWVAAAAIFGVGLWFSFGEETAAEFYAGYLVEQSLSVDNLFVFLLLFDYFKVPLSCQDRVLNYGIYGAVVMRAVMIGLGAVALQQFHGILLVFAAVLVYSSASVLLNLGNEEEEEEDMGENKIVQFSRNLFDATEEFDGDRFFTAGKATPLFICMVAVEISDVVFAVDSIPAVFGVTENPLVVFTSNMFAIMGLRSLYTILSKAASDLEYLEPAVAVVLAFIGSKMIAEYFGFLIPTEVSLAVVITVLFTGILSSIYANKQETGDEI